MIRCLSASLILLLADLLVLLSIIGSYAVAYTFVTFGRVELVLTWLGRGLTYGLTPKCYIDMMNGCLAPCNGSSCSWDCLVLCLALYELGCVWLAATLGRCSCNARYFDIFRIDTWRVRFCRLVCWVLFLCFVWVSTGWNMELKYFCCLLVVGWFLVDLTGFGLN